MNIILNKVLASITRIGADPADNDDLRLRKSLLVLSSFPFAFAASVWGPLYIYFNEPLAGSIPLFYAFVSLLSIIHFSLTRKFKFFQFSQLFLILLLPFFLMMTLGGFIGGSIVILWALICPLGALLFDNPDRAIRWFFAFIGLVLLSVLIQPYLRQGNNLSSDVVKLFFVINISGVSFLVFLLVYYFVGQKNIFQEKSETLLLNILPREIAAILKNEQRTIAEQYDGASILFADMVNFTSISKEISALEIVNLLNEIFSNFDSLVDKYGLEKIKTIGDCYMVAAGVPNQRQDHASAILNLALDMIEYIQHQTFFVHYPIAFRIGINSGPVLAGVIGRKKFIYDLWGDAVNTASRMESHGQPGTIQITRATYELVKDQFICEPRGTINLKGKGEMEVWFVTGRKIVPLIRVNDA